jgi:hypothetical protein
MISNHFSCGLHQQPPPLAQPTSIPSDDNREHGHYETNDLELFLVVRETPAMATLALS